MDKSYQSYSLEELSTDADFKDWVLKPTPESNAFWQDFLQKYPEKAFLIEEAKDLILGVHTYFDKANTDSQKLTEYFKELSQRADRESSQIQPTTIIRRFPYRKLVVAATVLLLISVIGFLWVSQQNSYQTYTTAYGEWETVSLPDGSTVKLNANSELKFASNWEKGKNRKVWLKGEAFFEVEKKPTTGAKFFVMADEVMVEVLGTSFNVNSRDEKTEVFLEEGKIKLEAGTNESYMVPGDLISYSASKKQIIENRKGVNDIHSSWKDGVLILQENTVEEIFNKISEIYGVEFQVEDRKILESKTTIRIPMDKLVIAIPILEKTLNVMITQKDNLLIIK